jgi:hypothetical protein
VFYVGKKDMSNVARKEVSFLKVSISIAIGGNPRKFPGCPVCRLSRKEPWLLNVAKL